MNRSYGVRLAVIALVFLAGAGTALGQSRERLEVGGQLAAVRLGDFDATNFGVGGRLSYDIFRRLAIEGEFSFIPHDDITIVSSVPSIDLGIAHHRRRSEVFFGTKLGVRGQKLGVFAKVRPGFARLQHLGMGCVGESCALVSMLLVLPVYRTEFALDLGGVLEFYPSPRTVARIDVGSMLVRHRSAAPPCWRRRCTTSDFTSRVGLGWRF